MRHKKSRHERASAILLIFVFIIVIAYLGYCLHIKYLKEVLVSRGGEVKKVLKEFCVILCSSKDLQLLS